MPLYRSTVGVGEMKVFEAVGLEGDALGDGVEVGVGVIVGVGVGVFVEVIVVPPNGNVVGTPIVGIPGTSGVNKGGIILTRIEYEPTRMIIAQATTMRLINVRDI